MSEAAAPAAQHIADRRAAYCRAIAARRVDELGGFLDPDLVIIASTGALRIGRDAAITNYAANEFLNPDFISYDRVTDTVEISHDGTVAVERGHWQAHLRQADGSIGGPSGLYQAGWTLHDGIWLIRSEAYVRLS